MHPIVASTTRIMLYLLAWLPVTGLLAFLLHVTGGISLGESAVLTGPLCLFYAFVCLSPWYLCRVLPLGAGQIASILWSHIAAGAVAGLLWIVVAKGLGLLISRYDPPFDLQLSRDLPMLFIFGILLYMLAVSLHYVLLSFQTSRDAEMQAHESLMLAREAELKALKAQINPHFLFNSLNSISALTVLDAAKARDMCIRLSDFLRSTLSLGDKRMIAFSEELALARTYLSVEQIRFGARLRICERVDAGCGSCLVPPLVMQPLVENAVKHGIAGMLEGGTIRLEACCGNGQLRIGVENEFDADAPAPRKNGLGLTNVRGRLRALYDNRARLDTCVHGNSFLAELSLPCEDRSHA